MFPPQVQALSSSPSPSRILIDVREPDEYAAGYIPSAINIPLESAPDAWYLPADEFQDRFGVPKPESDTEVVFYCKAGIRSRTAAGMARQVGYQRVGEYAGSWLDWQRHEGGKERG